MLDHLHLLRAAGEAGGGVGGEELQLQVRVVLHHQVLGVHQQEDQADLCLTRLPRSDHQQPQLAQVALRCRLWLCNPLSSYGTEFIQMEQEI